MTHYIILNGEIRGVCLIVPQDAKYYSIIIFIFCLKNHDMEIKQEYYDTIKDFCKSPYLNLSEESK